jgi:pimeloyl-ACP methyl ester carboxylesterase
MSRSGSAPWLFYEDRGIGEPMLLLAGFAVSSAVFDPVADAYARHFRCLTFDYRAGQQAGSLERESAAPATVLGGGPVLAVPIGERVVWAWTSGDRVTDDPTSVAHRMGERVRAAIGTCREGLDGMADSHDEARVARRVAELRAVRPGAVVGYRAADLTGLLTADPVEAVRFAEAELGELLAATDTAARLRATVQTYLEENLSPARAARRLGIHQNTVVSASSRPRSCSAIRSSGGACRSRWRCGCRT